MTITTQLQDELEEQMARRMAPVMRDARRKIRNQLRGADLDDIALADLDVQVWDDITVAFERILEDELSQAYIAAANEFADSIGYHVPQDLLEEAAAGWAQTTAFNLAQGLNRTSQNRLSTLLTQFNQGSMTNRELMRRMGKIFGPDRASVISVTEVTRAAAEGQSWVARQLGAAGVEMIAIWYTMQDEMVCPVCGPRHDMAQGTNWFMLPPAHPNCRCGVRFEVVG